MIFDDIISTLGLGALVTGIVFIALAFMRGKKKVEELDDSTVMRIVQGSGLTVFGILLSLLGIIGLLTHNLR